MEKIFILGKMVGIIAASTILGTALLAVVYSLPVDRIIHNVQNSVAIYNKEGDEPLWAGGYCIVGLTISPIQLC